MSVVLAMRVQVTETTKLLLDAFDLFELEYRHNFEYGGRQIPTYWLNGLKDRTYV